MFSNNEDIKNSFFIYKLKLRAIYKQLILMSGLDKNLLTFGKYKNSRIQTVLRDRSYCEWFLSQPELANKYEFLYNTIKEYDPKVYFHPAIQSETGDFIKDYLYFNLTQPDNLGVKLGYVDSVCYNFYLSEIKLLKDKIINNSLVNQYNIKAPTKWLQKFETETGLKRECFKEFLSAHELPNIPYIIEDIKKQGNIVYNGARSFIIAKERSMIQESIWRFVLKSKYGEDVSEQFKYKKCIFDFLNISTNTIYECKLTMGDFNRAQHDKYIRTLNEYKLLYLFGIDAVFDIHSKKLYTTDALKYQLAMTSIVDETLREIIKDVVVEEISNIENFL